MLEWSVLGRFFHILPEYMIMVRSPRFSSTVGTVDRYELRAGLVGATFAMAVLAQLSETSMAQLTPSDVAAIFLEASRPKATDDAESPDYAALDGKWIVRFVKRDGKPNAAQIGQNIGDVITIKKDADQIGFG
jgi:hypothetical protein